VLACCLLAAAPPATERPEDLIRRANAAFLAGDRDEANRLYGIAEEQTADPGLVAFNQAAVLFQKGEFREAEVFYARVLDDAACPTERAVKAWYNRGTCLLRRGGSASVYRSAIACLERCVDSPDADAPLKADARHNLELAKALWNEARKSDQKEKPNSPPPPEDPRSEPKPEPKHTGKEPEPKKESGKNDTSPTTKTGQQPKIDPKADPTDPTNPNPDPKTQPNSGTPTAAPQLKNEDAVQQLSPEDTREHLRRIAERLKKDRHDLLRTLYPPDRPGSRDW
jgi:tetratricopeptide (TPR) repeat protein